jgi:hypothetical protein
LRASGAFVAHQLLNAVRPAAALGLGGCPFTGKSKVASFFSLAAGGEKLLLCLLSLAAHRGMAALQHIPYQQHKKSTGAASQ